MIGIIFEFNLEYIEVRVYDSNCLFRIKDTNKGFATIENLNLNKAGCIKEFPDLKDDKDWKDKTIKRFKQKMGNYKTETERANYIITDLEKFGYIPRYYQKSGYRPIKLNDGDIIK